VEGRLCHMSNKIVIKHEIAVFVFEGFLVHFLFFCLCFQASSVILEKRWGILFTLTTAGSSAKR